MVITKIEVKLSTTKEVEKSMLILCLLPGFNFQSSNPDLKLLVKPASLFQIRRFTFQLKGYLFK